MPSWLGRLGGGANDPDATQVRVPIPVTKDKAVKTEFYRRFPDQAATAGFEVTYTKGKVGGQGTYHIQTTKDWSRSNLTGLGLVEHKQDQPGDFTYHSTNAYIREFVIDEAALEKALGMSGPASGAAATV